MSDEIVIGGIWLRYEGGENDPRAKVVVEVEIDGEWVPVIVEAYGSSFSHCVTAEGIRRELAPPG